MDIEEKRGPKREDTQMIPQPVEGRTGVVQVDPTWGKIQPMHVSDGVRTVEELELNEHLERGNPVVDARTTDFYEESTIPGAENIPYDDIVERMDELDRERTTIFFCNGPQCPQSPTAIRNLLDAGFPADKILYYRGGVHDWVTLGLPYQRGR